MLILERRVGSKVLIGDRTVLSLESVGMRHIEIRIEKTDEGSRGQSTLLGRPKGKTQRLYYRKKTRVGEAVDVTFVKITKCQTAVRLGIEAPAEVGIFREEAFPEHSSSFRQNQMGVKL